MISYIYLIESVLADNYTYKIGFTNRPVNNRLYEINTYNPGDNRILFEYETKHNRKIETYLHNYFKSKRIKREWFYLTKDDISNFIPICNKLENQFDKLKELNNYYIKQEN